MTAAQTTAPTKSALDIQQEAEKDRLRFGFSKNSFASTILTSGFGTGGSGLSLGGVQLGV